MSVNFNYRTSILLWHLLVVAPLLLLVAIKKSKTPPIVYTIFGVFAISIFIFHGYKLYTHWVG